jgi:curved DNA-binding protein CbpA
MHKQYKTLGVSKTADIKTIKKAYYAKVFEIHPDRQAVNDDAKKSKSSPKGQEKESIEFIRTVKSWEILSDPKRRREYDRDAALGTTSKYANEAEGRSGPVGSDDTSWHPKYGGGDSGASGRQSAYYGADWQGHDRDFYQGPMNTGPLYMANWKMAFLIIGVAMVVGTGFLSLFNMRRNAYNYWRDQQEGQAMAFYEQRRKRAQELGFDNATEPLRERARQMEVEVALENGELQPQPDGARL